MAGNQHNDWGHSDVGGNKLPDQGSGNERSGNEQAGNEQSGSQQGGNSGGAPAGDASRQKDEQGQGGASASSSGVYTNFRHASPESNVNPPGAPQNSHGSATGPLPGGVEGQYWASQNAQAGMGAAAAGGNAGSRQGSDEASDAGLHGADPDGGAPSTNVDGNGSR